MKLEAGGHEGKCKEALGITAAVRPETCRQVPQLQRVNGGGKVIPGPGKHCCNSRQEAEVAQCLCGSPRPCAIIKTQMCVAYVGKTHLQLMAINKGIQQANLSTKFSEFCLKIISF